MPLPTVQNTGIDGNIYGHLHLFFLKVSFILKFFPRFSCLLLPLYWLKFLILGRAPTVNIFTESAKMSHLLHPHK